MRKRRAVTPARYNPMAAKPFMDRILRLTHAVSAGRIWAKEGVRSILVQKCVPRAAFDGDEPEVGVVAGLLVDGDLELLDIDPVG